jgi:uncharacterized protein YchJ
MLTTVVASTTHRDKHGDKMTKEALESMADKIEKSGRVPAVNIEHKYVLPPMGKVISAEVVPRKDGEYQLEVNQEIFENEREINIKGEKLIELSSQNDKRPFSKNFDYNKDKLFTIAYDFINFSKSDLDELIEKTDDFAETKTFGRKSLVPDPVVMFMLGSLVYFSRKVVKKTSDKLAEEISHDAVKFYGKLKEIIPEIVDKIRPTNKVPTFIFKTKYPEEKDLVVEFVVKSKAPLIIEEALINIEECINKIEEFLEMFDIEMIQFIFNVKEKTWHFNYFTTNEGKVVGSKKSFENLRIMRIKLDGTNKVPVGRNDLCPCGSGLKYKKCCM